jgi:hypothetical protein
MRNNLGGPGRPGPMEHPQDINSRRFDPRSFSGPEPPGHRQMDMRGGNSEFRSFDHGPGPQSNQFPPPSSHHGGRGLDLPPHRQGELRMDFRDPRHQMDPRQNDLRTYDRQQLPHSRGDPRMNFSVGLPPPPSGLGPLSSSSSVLPPPPSIVPQQPSHRLPPQPSSVSMSHQQSSLAVGSPFGPSLFAAVQRPSVTEVIPVHVDLAAFASEPKFQQILLKVKEQSSVNFISLNRIADDLVESIVIDSPTRDAALLAKNLIETHLKLQMKIKAAENRLHRVQTDLFSTQGEIAAGQMIEFMISPDLIGLAIGKKGSRIKQIEMDTNVSSINVSDNGKLAD